MEAAPVTRPATPADCRERALLDGSNCVVLLLLASSPPHWTFIPPWLFSLLFTALACINARPVLYWLLVSRHMGQTVAYRIRPRGHPFRLRTVTYPIPQVPDKAEDKPLLAPFSMVITLALTLLTCFWTFAAVDLFSADAGTTRTLSLVFLVIDISLIVYTLYCWKRVGQEVP